jgi:glycosyltransferase involved in cell wall biosynthesis
MKTLAFLLHHLSPMHAARVDALDQHLKAEGIWKLEVIVLSGCSTVYPWIKKPAECAASHRVLFETKDSRECSPPQVRRAVRSVLKEISPQSIALSGWWDNAMLSAMQWGVQKKRSLIMMSDSQEQDAPRTPFKEWVKQQVVGACQAGFVAGQRSAQYLEKLGMPAEAISLGYDVVDNERIHAKVEEIKKSAAEWCEKLKLPSKYFVAMGRMVQRKNFLGILKAFKSFIGAGETGDTAEAPASEMNLVIAGDGPERENLESWVAENGLEKNVHFPGQLEDEDLLATLSLSSGLIHASDVEQWGLAVNEAMAASLPVVVSEQCGCVPELVQNDVNGYMFSANDESALTSAMQQLAAKSPDQRSAMGNEGRAIIADWGLDRFAKGMSEALARGEESARQASFTLRCIAHLLSRQAHTPIYM